MGGNITQTRRVADVPTHIELSDSERACLTRFSAALASYGEAFGEAFYEILSQTSEVATYLQHITPAQLARLREGQVEHFRKLVTTSDDDHDIQQHSIEIGKLHYFAGVNPLWILIGYSIYDTLCDRFARTVCLNDQETLDLLLVALRKRLRADEYHQLRGYRRAVIAALKEAQEKSVRDDLTGLPNRGQISWQIERAITCAQDSQTSFAVIMLDLDDFKIINDRFGHAAGDAVLSQLASRLRLSLRSDDFAARYAGDEFVILISGLESQGAAEAILNRIDSDLSMPYRFDGKFIPCTATIGATIYPQDNGLVDDLLRHADRALYLSKSRKAQRQRRWALYTELLKTPRRSSDMVYDLTNNLRLEYQPIFDVRSGKCVRLEALARIQTGNDIAYPGTFLPGLSAIQKRELFQSVLDRALADARQWVEGGHAWDLSVNVEPFLPLANGFIDILQATLEKYRFAPSRLTLEILEDNHDITRSEADVIFGKLVETGVRLALDDLGINDSNLKRLQMLPIHEVKLDQSFTLHLAHNPGDLPFALNMLNLAQNLDMEFVAEGVEDEETLDVLMNLGVQRVQGYALCHPVPAAELYQTIATSEARLGHRKVHINLLSGYAKHLSIETHLLGLFRHAPQHLHAAHLRDMSLCPLLPMLRDHPEMQALHEQQHKLMTSLADNAAEDSERAIEEYIRLGKQLRMLMTTAISRQNLKIDSQAQRSTQSLAKQKPPQDQHANRRVL